MQKKLDDNSRLDVVEIARFPDMLPSVFSSLVGLRTYQHPCIITGVMCLYEYFLKLKLANGNRVKSVGHKPHGVFRSRQ